MKNRYQIYSGYKLSEEMYLATWELDNTIFEEKDLYSKQHALDWFEYSGRSTIVLWDNEENRLVGYITPFLLNHDFACDYIISGKTYMKAINKSSFVKPYKNVEGDIYLFSTVVVEEFRDKVLPHTAPNSKMHNKSAFKILNEALVDWIADIVKKGVSISYVFSERVTDEGEKYLRSLGMQPCFVLKDDCKFAKMFEPTMFERCSNVNKLKSLCEDEQGKKFNKKLLANHEFLSIKDNVLHYKDINLLDLVEKYNAPLEVGYTPMITEKIEWIKGLFADKIKKYKYPNKYCYAYATKANYYSEVVLTAINSVDMLETSSAYDIDIIYNLASHGYIKKGYTVLCNGFKNEKYVQTLKKLLNKGINVIPIIENEREFHLIKSLKKHKINVGLRYNSDFESRLIKNSFKIEDSLDNRFGFDKFSLIDIAKEISETDNLTLKVLHFHFGGSVTNIDNYIKAYANIMDCYCELKKQIDSLEYFDFGGGFPVKYSLSYSFNYEELIDKMVKTSKDVCKKHKVDCPILIGEHGRITTADHSFYIYKVDFAKKANNQNWYIINGSLMNMTPDIWGIEQDFTILPVNLYENDCIPVCLGGETCDPDDRYFLKDKNVKLLMPKVDVNQTLYIAIFSIGAYQEIISGIGGLHHCLIPEGNELVIYKGKDGKLGYYETGSVTDKRRVLGLLDYDDKKYMQKFTPKGK